MERYRWEGSEWMDQWMNQWMKSKPHSPTSGEQQNKERQVSIK
jgi:hypothetical protein